MEIKTIKSYISFDGRVFDTQEDCEIYEAKQKNKIEIAKQINSLKSCQLYNIPLISILDADKHGEAFYCANDEQRKILFNYLYLYYMNAWSFVDIGDIKIGWNIVIIDETSDPVVCDVLPIDVYLTELIDGLNEIKELM